MQRDVLTVVIQINGKLRGKIEVPASASKEEVEQLALTEQNIVRHLEGLTVRKVVVIPANSSTWWPTDEQTASGFGTCRVWTPVQACGGTAERTPRLPDADRVRLCLARSGRLPVRNSVLGNGSKTLKIKSVEQTSLYPWLTYQSARWYGTTSTLGTWRSGWMTDRLTIPDRAYPQFQGPQLRPVQKRLATVYGYHQHRIHRL